MEKKLYRSRTDRMVAGICGGIANYFNIDPVIVRVIWLLAIFGGAGIIIYIIAWIIIPENTVSESQEKMVESGLIAKSNKRTSELFGYLLIILGGVLLIEKIYPWWQVEKYWPVLIIILGLVIIFSEVWRKDEHK